MANGILEDRKEELWLGSYSRPKISACDVANPSIILKRELLLKMALLSLTALPTHASVSRDYREVQDT